MHLIKLLLLLFCVINTDFALAMQNQTYEKALEQLKQIPNNAKPVLPLLGSEKKNFISLINQLSPTERHGMVYSLDTEGRVIDQDKNTDYEIYSGDFSNDGSREYVMVSMSGSLGVNTVSLYKIINQKLIPVDLDNIISTDLLKGEDLGPNFYLYTAHPFAVIQNGKTYLRYMSYPYKTYDKSKLLLCTYFLYKDHIRLTGPNYTFSAKTGKLIPAITCIH